MRLVGLDVFRGLAIVLMVVYHVCYHLDLFHYIDIDMEKSLYWRSFRAIIVSMFLFAMGVSLHLAYANGIDTIKLSKRVLLLASSATLISVATIVVYPHSWVFFGIIHFVLVATVLGLWLLNKPSLAFAISVVLVVGYFGGIIPFGWLVGSVAAAFGLPKYTVDFVPLLPWFWVVSLALAVAAKGWHIPFSKVFEHMLSVTKLPKVLAFFGRHALVIYLMHLPALYGVFMLIRNIG